MTDAEKIKQSMAWFRSLRDWEKDCAFRGLVKFAIQQDYVSVFSEEDQSDLSEESGKHISEYSAPYITSCGEPIGAQFTGRQYTPALVEAHISRTCDVP